MAIWIGFLTISFGFVTVLALCVLPRLVLLLHAAGYVCRDRGIRKVNVPRGCVLVCEPSVEARAYLEQYAVARLSGSVVFTGKWREEVESAEYELFCYDGAGTLIKTVLVKEYAERQRVPLPGAACFVSPELISVNGKACARAPRSLGALLRFAGALLLFCWLLLCFCSLCCEVGFSHLFSAGVYFLPEGGWEYLAAVCAAIFAGCAAVFAAILFKARFPHGKKTRVRKSAEKKTGRFPLRAGNAAYRFLNLFTGAGRRSFARRGKRRRA